MSREDSRVRSARRHAKTLGLQMVLRRSGAVELFGAGHPVHSGTLDTVEAYLHEQRTNQPPRRYKPQPPGAWPLMIDDYVRSLAAAGQRQASLHLRRDHLNRIGRGVGCGPDAVTAELLVDWFGQQTHWKLETRRGYRNAARKFFQWAYKTGRVSADLSDALPCVRQIMPAARPTPDDVWREAWARADARTRLMMRLAAEAGLRRGEVARVQTSDVLDGIDGARLVVNGKGGKVRILPISDSLADAIRQGASGHTPGAPAQGWLFPRWGDGVHVSEQYVGLLVAAALPGQWTMHSLRHRMASRAYRGTRNLRAVQMLLGHSSIATTERYLAVDDSEMRAAMTAAGL
jgi:integrase/recombinase XerC